MELKSEIFDDRIESQLKKYSKRVSTGRIMVFATAAIIFATTAVITFITLSSHDGDATRGVLIFGFPGVIFLLLGFFSLKNPFIALLMASGILGLFFLYGFFNFIDWSDTNDILVSSGLILLQSGLLFFLGRGAYFARKRIMILEQADGR